jgi:uncharacterized membrane protein YeaQ/YmgE (transglycosylase-associated protein family)
MLWTLLIGLLAGIVAKFFIPGKDPGGIIITMLLGIAGSFVAGWMGDFTGIHIYGAYSGFIASVFGAMVILFVYKMIFRRKT